MPPGSKQLSEKMWTQINVVTGPPQILIISHKTLYIKISWSREISYWNVQLLKSLRNLADYILVIPTSCMPCSMSIRQTWTRISGLRDIARFCAKKSYCSLYWHHGTLLPAATSLGLERRKTGWADTWKPQSASQWRRMNIMTSSITHNPAVWPSACED